MRDTRVQQSSPVRATARFLARHPRSVGSLTAGQVTALYVGYQTMLIAAGCAVVAGASWAVLDRPTFDRFAGRLLRAWWRRWVVYQRQWARIAFACGLAQTDRSGTTVLPKLLRARATLCWDSVHVRMVKGQDPGDYEQVLDRLANAYKARRATLRTLKPGVISLDFQLREPFDTMHIGLPELPENADEVDLSKLVLGKDEYGRDFAIDLINGLHHLMAGATGAGKGSWVWGLLWTLAPLIRNGSVRLWGIDPKGGMELGAGREMFHRFADNDHDGVAVTREYVDTLDERKERLGRQGVRTHTPSPADPLDVLIVDELAAMTEYASDRDIPREFEPLLGKALTQYRAVGGRVIAEVQEPNKQTVPMRGLFPTKVCLRVDESSYVDMTLGEGARDRGALADQIPDYMPGVGYIKRDGQREPLRVRAAYTADEDIARLVAFCTSTDADVITFPTGTDHADVEDAEVIDEYEYIDPDEHDDDTDIA